jgi:hypothetical protein
MEESAIDTAMRLLRSGDELERKKGVAIVEEQLEAGSPLATYAVGTWYLHGANGYPKEPERAAKLIASAADQFVTDAVCDIAFSLEKGIGVEKDFEEALAHYLVAAILGDEDAVHDVARCFDEGIGVKADITIANRLYRLYKELPDLREKKQK